MTGHEVSMEVAEKDVTNLKAKLFGVGQVLLDVSLRIDDDGGPALLIAEQIGGVRQTSEVVLLQDHRSSISLIRRVSGGQTEHLFIIPERLGRRPAAPVVRYNSNA